MASKRSLLFIVYSGTPTAGFFPMDGVDISEPLEAAFRYVLIAMRLHEEQSAADYSLYNWDVEPLCRTTGINDIPNPGVVLAVKTDVGDDPKSVAMQLKLVGQMSKEEIVQQQLASFIGGNRSDSEPTAPEGFGKRLLSALEVKPGWMGLKSDLKKLMEKNKPK